VVWVLFLAGKSHLQSWVWHDSQSLFQHTVDTNPTSLAGLVNLGKYYADQGPELARRGLYQTAEDSLRRGIVLYEKAAKNTLLPLGAMIVGCIVAFLICRSAARAWPDAVEVGLGLPKMWVVLRLAAGLGLAGAVIVWFAGTVVRTSGPSARSPLFLMICGAVMCLLGFTPLPELLVPMPFLIMLGLGIVAAVLLNNTIWGRYLLALGRNEQAARYSGINTHSMIILAYVICSLLAGLGGMLFVLDVNSAQPADFGNFYELYAIAAAVLGGCSLRGGEGTIAGVVIGAAVMQILKNSINLLDFPTQLEYAIIGSVLLIGVMADELTKRVAARRKIVT